MKKIIPALLFAFLLASCNGWSIQPLPNPPTPFLPPTLTPSVFTATPVVIGVTSVSSTPIVSSPTAFASATATPFPTFTTIPTMAASDTPTITLPTQVNIPSVAVNVLGCNTSIDIVHGMGEVTNAFVVLKNNGSMVLTNLKVTLFALDEGREHPDKTVELTSLPVGYQVIVKLTVDSTFRQETPIQIEVTSDQGTFPREGLASCKDIGVLAPNPDLLNTPVPGNP
jgi:hypothetical protein